ncbi:IclR family transcriptional regulator [Nocardia gipuzkoensis]|uniref:IclR family transcriptional regulator n=1 Tax=Nocardia gipuzkoensis TaxID=2749991 RepID=UPI0015EF81C7|nr:IclR family transcriptional regulator [Nocardia gipuzkoensis]
MKNKPAYSVESVDNALHLAQLLLLEGPMRLTDGAARLGVAASTAHRLFAMLVYRDFAEQGPDRLYRPGPALRGSLTPGVPTGHLRRVAQPHLEQLVETVNESANLLVLSGTDVRFVSTVECDQVLRVGDRAGKALPAHLTSAGKAMLAHVADDRLSSVLSGLDETERQLVQRGISAVRRNGFAVNKQGTETGLAAVGMAVLGPDRSVVGGISLAIPTVRFHKDAIDGWVRRMSECVVRIENDLT